MEEEISGHAFASKPRRDQASSRFSRNRRNVSRKSKQTESITFRLDSDVLDKLRREADRKDISVNTLVSQIAKQHTSWHSVAAQAGFIALRRPLIIKLVEKHSEDEIKHLAQYMANTSNKDFVLLLRSKYNIHSALDVIETWIRISGYPHTHNIDERSYSYVIHSFVIQHDMGRKWSLYLSELYQNLFREFGVLKYHFDLSPNTLAFEVVLSAEEEGIISGNETLRMSGKGGMHDSMT